MQTQIFGLGVPLGFLGDDASSASALDSIPGVSSVVDYIKGKAQAGAEAAIPDIQAQVKQAVQPYVIAAFVLGAFGLLFGIAAYKNRKRKAPAAAAGTSGARSR